MMIPTLLDFLKTGAIGKLRLGLTVDEVRALLGTPDDVCGTSHRHPRPTIYVYGSIELFFTQSRPTRCVGLWWYAHRGPFRLAEGGAGEQLLSSGMRQEEVEAWLTNALLTFHAPAPEEGIAPTLVLASGVTVILDDDGLLYAVAANER